MGAQRAIIIILVLLISQFWLKGFALNHSILYERDKQPKSLSLEDILLHLTQYCDRFGDSKLTITYSNYQFFTVETEVVIKARRPPGLFGLYICRLRMDGRPRCCPLSPSDNRTWSLQFLFGC
jgi:hypothetical protein